MSSAEQESSTPVSIATETEAPEPAKPAAPVPVAATLSFPKEDAELNGWAQGVSKRAKDHSRAIATLGIRKEEYKQQKKAWQDKVARALEVAKRAPSSVLMGAIGHKTSLSEIEEIYQHPERKAPKKELRYSANQKRLDTELEIVKKHHATRSLLTSSSPFESIRSRAEEPEEKLYSAFKEAMQRKAAAKQTYTKQWSYLQDNKEEANKD